MCKNVCLVTGGAGFIGSHLVRQLLDIYKEVRVLDNLSNGKEENLPKSSSLQFTKGDVTNVSDILKVIENVDTIFHLACLGVRHSIANPFENHKVNAEGTLLLLQHAMKYKIRKFLYCSSSEVYGSAEKVPMTEKHTTFPCTVYGASKLAGEAYTRAFYKTYQFDTVIVRPFNSYGPRSHYEGDAGEFIPKAIVRALNGHDITIFGDGSQTRDFTYVEDTARGLIDIATYQNVSGKTFNLGSGFEISMKDLARKILSFTASDSSIQYISQRPGDVKRLYGDNFELKKISSWKPIVSLDEGLHKTINYFKNHPDGLENLLKKVIIKNW